MRSQQKLLTGAAYLAGAGLIVKVIGACFKIPLGALLGPEGIAVFSVAYNLYALLFVVATAGVPIAVSKLVAESVACGRGEDAKRVVKAAFFGFSAIGLCGSILLFFGARPFSCMMGAPDAEQAIRAIAPAVLFVSVLSICRGYYQGYGDMLPTAVSEVIEALGKLILGLFAAWWLGQGGKAISVRAAVAIGGVSAGAAIACVYFFFAKRRICMPIPKSGAEKTAYRVIIRNLFSQALPITMGAAVIGLTNVIDSAVIMKLLQSIGCSTERSMWMYGTYTYATNLFNLPNVLVSTLAVSLIPAVAGAKVLERRAELEGIAEHALSVAALLASAAAFGLGVLAQPVLDLLYGSGVEQAAIELAGELLVILCLGIPPLALTTVTNALHQAAGRVKIPVISMLFGAAVKLISNLFLIQIPEIHILGAAISTVLCYTVIAGINWVLLVRSGEISGGLLRLWWKPILVGISTGVGAKVVFCFLIRLINAKITVILSVFGGVIVFFAVSSLLRISFFEGINTKISAKKVKR